MNEAEHYLTLYGSKRNVLIPTRETITEQDRQQFDTFHKKLKEYQGRPEPVIAAFELAKGLESQSLFATAMARVVQTNAYVQGRVYDDALMEEAVEWLELAQSVAPDEQAVLHAAIDVHSSNQDYEQSKRALDRAQTLYPNEFDFKLCNLHLINRTGTLRQVRKAVGQIDENGLTPKQRRHFWGTAADSFLAHSDWKQSGKLYKKVAGIEPDNPWVWHNLSIARFNDKKTLPAFLANRKALQLMDFGVAQQFKKEIQTKLLMEIGKFVFLLAASIVYLLYKAGVFEGVF